MLFYFLVHAFRLITGKFNILCAQTQNGRTIERINIRRIRPGKSLNMNNNKTQMTIVNTNRTQYQLCPKVRQQPHHYNYPSGILIKPFGKLLSAKKRKTVLIIFVQTP